MSGSDMDVTFEEALEQLEGIVGRLERGDGDLSSALKSYERGVKLLGQCHTLLDSAEKSVAVLTGVDEAGNPLTSPFDSTATADSNDRSPGRSNRS